MSHESVNELLLVVLVERAAGQAALLAQALPVE